MSPASNAAAVPAAWQPIYEWRGRDRQGRCLNGHLRASTRAQVQLRLQSQGIFPTRVARQRTSWLHTPGRKDRVMLLQQLATLMKAGIPLLQSLDTLIRSCSKPTLRVMLQEVRAEVSGGNSLADALRCHLRFFTPQVCHLVAVGESSGTLDDVLQGLADHEEKSLKLQNKLRAALAYPAMVLCVAVMVMAVMLTVVVPTFREVFASFGSDLPALTQTVLRLSSALATQGVWIVLLCAGALGSFIMLQRRSPTVQAWLDRSSLRLPLLGAVMRQATVARWMRTLATQIGAGVPLVEALSRVGEACGRIAYAQATRAMTREVSSGQRLSTAMERAACFPPMVLQMTHIGEESGSLDVMLNKAAELMESELEERLKALSSLLEPCILLLMGLMIGAIVVALYLPVFQLGAVV